ncbi:AAA family ATPase [Caldalkalibacillus salinus]|uniref:AAA family ATPase n=1 Tax=Caldalkalibacillus salinus TaxID=2803787 RepID=UPI001922CDE7
MIEQDQEYVDLLLQYIRTTKKGKDVRVSHFTDVALFYKQSTQLNADVILIHESLIGPQFDSSIVPTSSLCFMLTEQKQSQVMLEGDDSIDVVFKYQPYSKLLHSIRQSMNKSKEIRMSSKDNSSKVIAVHSSSGGTGTTTLSLTFSSQLSLFDLNVLYVNLEEMNSITSFLTTEEEDVFSKLLYYAQSERGADKLEQQLLSCIRFDPKWKMDYIPPLHLPEELNELSYDNVTTLIRAIRQLQYDYIILDVGHLNMTVRDAILSSSHQIFWMMNDCFHSVNKTKRHVELLQYKDEQKTKAWLAKTFFLCNKYTGQRTTLAFTQDWSVTEYLPYIPEWKNIVSKDQMLTSQVFNEKLIRLQQRLSTEGRAVHE